VTPTPSPPRRPTPNPGRRHRLASTSSVPRWRLATPSSRSWASKHKSARRHGWEVSQRASPTPPHLQDSSRRHNTGAACGRGWEAPGGAFPTLLHLQHRARPGGRRSASPRSRPRPATTPPSAAASHSLWVSRVPLFSNLSSRRAPRPRSTAQHPPPSFHPRPVPARLHHVHLCSVPSVRTETEPKEPKPNGSIFGSDFLGTEVSREPKNRTDRFG
jgi:hypothetical protein